VSTVPAYLNHSQYLATNQPIENLAWLEALFGKSLVNLVNFPPNTTIVTFPGGHHANIEKTIKTQSGFFTF
jgi:hypothetical protein